MSTQKQSGISAVSLLGNKFTNLSSGILVLFLSGQSLLLKKMKHFCYLLQ